MSYTKQTWATGDTVTATKLNHMEDGIEGAGGGATIKFEASGFSSSSHLYAYIVYAVYENGSWVVNTDDNSYWTEMYGYTNTPFRFLCFTLPADSNVGLFLIDCVNDDKIITGNISTTPTTIYYSYGSIVSGVGNNAYRITGDGTYEFIAS